MVLLESGFFIPKAMKVMRQGKDEVQRIWEDETLIMARAHNSRLSWEALASSINLDLFPFSEMKAVAPMGTLENKKLWLKKRMIMVSGERIYLNDWNPLCNRANLSEEAWFSIMGVSFRHWNDTVASRIGKELDILVQVDVDSLKFTTFRNFHIKIRPFASRWAGGKVLQEYRAMFGDVYVV